MPYDSAKRRRYYDAETEAQRQHRRDYAKKYYYANRETALAANSEWRKQNLEAYRVKRREDERQRRLRKGAELAVKDRVRKSRAYRESPQFCMRERLRSRLQIALRRFKIQKLTTTLKLVGCNMGDLCAHLEKQFLPGMTWDNRNLWHIDHIKPCAAFDLTDPEQQRTCFHWSNLRPLWAQDNMRKGARH